ncbi:MAG: hypothetical protein HKN87_07535 [Saprospiraceae bacterium]|nr:hypothetical protein [Saprospiraceae bacterium]
MQITVEISLYPLQSSYGETVLDFIGVLKSHADLTIRTNHMSTQVTGHIDAVMTAIQSAIKEVFSQEQKSALVFKVFSEKLDLDWIDLSE